MTALERLALLVESLFPVSCTFECRRAAFLRDSGIATQLYHVAQEAVNNAIRHGHPRGRRRRRNRARAFLRGDR